jgi:CheY-like chemotaxis protein
MDGPTRARALEPFFSTKQVAGAGLGLPMVNGFAIRSGGHLRVRSVPGAGTEVTLLLPLVTAESAAEVAAPVPGSAADQSEGHAARHAADAGSAGSTVIADPSSGGQPATVLVVDDEAVLRAIAERVMVGAGHRVLLAASGEEALEVAARAGRIDLLFTDIVMPGMHGIDLAAALRATRPDQRVLVTSGFTPDDIDRRGVGLAETPFLPKPYTPAELREAVATELRRGAETGSG